MKHKKNGMPPFENPCLITPFEKGVRGICVCSEEKENPPSSPFAKGELEARSLG
jgi:hypothetical protein